jgi:hypothetical protein
MEADGSLPHYQEPATCPHAEPDRPYSYPQTPFPEYPS